MNMRKLRQFSRDPVGTRGETHGHRGYLEEPTAIVFSYRGVPRLLAGISTDSGGSSGSSHAIPRAQWYRKGTYSNQNIPAVFGGSPRE